MKVLVVGGGYIGSNFAGYARRRGFAVDVVDSREGWKAASFQGYDAVLFAAGIAHRRQTKGNRQLYFQVNRDLALAVQAKAELANVGLFVYLSSMAVYGQRSGEITPHTKPAPKHNDYYGLSKFEAEAAMPAAAIIRPPMVYGPGCPGKFASLVRLAKILPVVPDSNNRRSMIYIDNLCEFLCMVIKDGKPGIFCPQNKEYVNTAQLVKLIRATMGKKTFLVSFPMGWLIKIVPPIKAAFGSLYYSAQENAKYKPINLKDSVHCMFAKRNNMKE